MGLREIQNDLGETVDVEQVARDFHLSLSSVYRLMRDGFRTYETIRNRPSSGRVLGGHNSTKIKFNGRKFHRRDVCLRIGDTPDATLECTHYNYCLESRVFDKKHSDLFKEDGSCFKAW